MNGSLEWLKNNWAIAITAVATAATALLIWLDRRDRKSRENPFVEFETAPCDASKPGWVRITLVVRNFNPYAVHVAYLRVKSPKTSALFSEREAYEPAVGGRTDTLAFVATDAKPKLSAGIAQDIEPVGAMSSGSPISLPHGADRIITRFFYSPGPGRSGEIKVKMALICEVRSRDVRTKEIPISRTITL